MSVFKVNFFYFFNYLKFFKIISRIILYNQSVKGRNAYKIIKKYKINKIYNSKQ